jgi:hypothetical protein
MYLGSMQSIESVFSIKRFLSSMGGVYNRDFIRSSFNFDFAVLEISDFTLMEGLSLRYESPMLHLSIRSLVLKGSLFVSSASTFGLGFFTKQFLSLSLLFRGKDFLSPLFQICLFPSLL